MIGPISVELSKHDHVFLFTFLKSLHYTTFNNS